MKFLLRETNQRLTFSNSKLDELRECLKVDHLTLDAESYIREEIIKTNRNIKYYSKILEQLENTKESE